MTDVCLYASSCCSAAVVCGVHVDELPPVAAASMWTRKDVKEFKDSLKNDHESVLKVGSGEIVTVSGYVWTAAVNRTVS